MMMNNMFSMFDPSSSSLSLIWVIMIYPALLTSGLKTKSTQKIKIYIASTITFVTKEMTQLMEKNLKFNAKMMSKLFIMVMGLNVLAIFPFNFTATAHMLISLPISMTLWASIVIFGFINNFKTMMAHLTPMGTPNSLMNFMVLIETISLIIRPITLSIRLSANMVAGHLLMSLLSSFSMISYFNTMVTMPPMLILMALEMMVAIVQAYVITTLLMLYQNET